MSTRLTASQIDRAHACPASLALPVVIRAPKREADRGSAIHRFLETALLQGRETALASLPVAAAWREICEKIELDYIICHAQDRECEVKLAYHLETDTAVVLERGSMALESASTQTGQSAIQPIDDVIVGTADLILTYPNGDVSVIDYKTGYQHVSLVENGQLPLLGLAVARARQLSEIFISIIQIDPDGGLIRQERLLSSEDLAAIAAKLRATARRVKQARTQFANGVTPDVKIGDHCHYCPAYRHCPATVSLARVILDPTANQFDLVSELSPADAGIVWERMQRARRLLDELEEGLKAYIDRTPIPLPDGKRVVNRVEIPRESIIGELAAPVLYEHLGEEAANIIEIVVTKTAIERQVKKITPSKTEAQLIIGEIFASLRQTGAVKESVTVSYKAGNCIAAQR